MENDENKDLKAILEALLLIADKPLTVNQARRVLDKLKPGEIHTLFKELAEEYNMRESGIEIYEVAGGYQLRTRPEMVEWVRKFHNVKPLRLSRPSLETLAIISYKQPLTRAEVEEIRGVDCGGVIKTLIDCRLVKVLGRKKVPGNPLLYGTSKEFLEVFQLQGLADLPPVDEFVSLGDDSDEQLMLPLEGEESTEEASSTQPEDTSVEEETPQDGDDDLPVEEPSERNESSDEGEDSEDNIRTGSDFSPQSGGDDLTGEDIGQREEDQDPGDQSGSDEGQDPH